MHAPSHATGQHSIHLETRASTCHAYLTATLHISLTAPLKEYVDASVESGGYTDASEYLTALEQRLLQALEGEAGAMNLTPEQVRNDNFFDVLRSHASKTR